MKKLHLMMTRMKKQTVTEPTMNVKRVTPMRVGVAFQWNPPMIPLLLQLLAGSDCLVLSLVIRAAV